MTFLRILWGLVLVCLGIAGIAIFYLAVGWAHAPSASDYREGAIVGVGIFGPLLFAGLHCIFFRPFANTNFDNLFVALICFCALGIVYLVFNFVVADSSSLHPKVITPVVFITLCSTLLGIAMVKVGRPG